MALVLLMMAMGYGNNLIYLSVFTLISVAFCSMSVTNENVRRVDVRVIRPAMVFAGENNPVPVQISNDTGYESFELNLSFPRGQSRTVPFAASPRKTVNVPIVWVPLRRGIVRLPRLTLESRFPFGLLRSWKNEEVTEEWIVSPERRGNPQFPTPDSAGREKGNLGLFRDHRPFQSTDSPRRVDWRATAKSQDLLVKNFEGSEKVPLHFDWEQTRSLPDFESRLSQLCLWLSKAEELGFSYSLLLGEFHSGESQGTDHLRRCLETLALLNEKDLE